MSIVCPARGRVAFTAAKTLASTHGLSIGESVTIFGPEGDLEVTLHAFNTTTGTIGIEETMGERIRSSTFQR